jgi:peptide deformylase
MSILPIVTYNDPILREKTKEVKSRTEFIDRFVEDLIETMYHSNGLGLAAPQVGSSHRIFVFDPDPVLEDDEEKFGLIVCINPKIIEQSSHQISMDEGCLSIPDVNDTVKRAEDITLHYLDEHFVQHTRDFTGWLARIILHEYDHLDGILFIDHLSSFRRRMHKSQLNAIEAGEAEASYPIRPKKHST